MSFMGKEPLRRDRPLTVTALNQQARELLEDHFPSVFVTGEASRVVHAASGHVYFALKDAGARIDAVLFATAARSLRTPLTEGLEINVRGQLSLYPQQGRYQIIVHAIEPAGEGALRAAFLKLKAKLDEDGLTNAARKRPLPFLPRAVGIVTSPTGAAIRDITEVIRRRFRTMRIVFRPTRVQGSGAAALVLEALRELDARDDLDVIIVGRGGGSQEDLWTFNDEALVRGIAAARHPIVSAVGHEIDVTLADLVADVRALTPTEAGERVVPILDELLRDVAALEDRLVLGARRTLGGLRRELEGLSRRPGYRAFPRRIEDERQALDELSRRLCAGATGLLSATKEQLVSLGRTLRAFSPAAWVRERRTVLAGLGVRLGQSVRHRVADARSALVPAKRALDALNPLGVLARGYTLTVVDDHGRSRVLRGAAPPGVVVRTIFARGPDQLSVVSGETPRALPEPGS